MHSGNIDERHMGWTLPWSGAFREFRDERAAILEFDAGLTREEADRIAYELATVYVHDRHRLATLEKHVPMWKKLYPKQDLSKEERELEELRRKVKAPTSE